MAKNVRKAAMKCDARWRVAKVDRPNKRVWIIDLDARKSITNDAEAVCAALHLEHPGYEFYYRDTDGNWDRLVHNEGRHIGFFPARRLAEQEGMK